MAYPERECSLDAEKRFVIFNVGRVRVLNNLPAAAGAALASTESGMGGGGGTVGPGAGAALGGLRCVWRPTSHPGSSMKVPKSWLLAPQHPHSGGSMRTSTRPSWSTADLDCESSYRRAEEEKEIQHRSSAGS